jgi:hypothetical protein
VDLTQAATWHRQAAALVAAADRVGVAEAELPAVRERLVTQQARLTAATAARGGWPLALAPAAADVAAAMPALGDLSPVAVAAALSAIAATLDTVDAALAGPARLPADTPTSQGGSSALTIHGGPDVLGQVVPPGLAPAPTPPPATGATWPPPTPPYLAQAPHRPPTRYQAPATDGGQRRRGIAAWPTTSRNLAVYAVYATMVTMLQVAAFAVYSERSLSLLGPCCLVVLPAFSWAAGWFTIGVAFGSGPSDREIDRTPRLGALVSLAPDLLLCAWLGVLLANA